MINPNLDRVVYEPLRQNTLDVCSRRPDDPHEPAIRVQMHYPGVSSVCYIEMPVTGDTYASGRLESISLAIVVKLFDGL